MSWWDSEQQGLNRRSNQNQTRNREQQSENKQKTGQGWKPKQTCIHLGNNNALRVGETITFVYLLY